MKIALLTNGLFPYQVGGMQKHSHHLARHMARMGVALDVYYIHTAAYPPRLTAAGYFGEDAGAAVQLIPVTPPRSMYYPGHYYADCHRRSKRMYETFYPRRTGVDFVYGQGYMGAYFARMRRAGADIPPVGINFHGLEAFQVDPPTWRRPKCLIGMMIRRNIRNILLDCDGVLSLGGRLDDILVQAGVPASRIYRSPNGIQGSWIADAPPPTVPEQPLRLIFVGRNTHRKGLHVLQHALDLAAVAPGRFTVTAVGVPDPETGDSDGHPIRYLGEITEEDTLRDLLSGADVYVCPSLSEGMPTTILEAMARGLAVIASDVGAVSDMVDPGNGWLVPPGDAGELARVLETVAALGGHELQARKERSLVMIRRFEWDRVAETTRESIQRIIDSDSRVGTR